MTDTKETQALIAERTKTTRLINLLQDIVCVAQNDPQKLTAFNSPWLQLAIIENYEHFNPDAEIDLHSKRIFQEQVKQYGISTVIENE